jgi:hypothetical protein
VPRDARDVDDHAPVAEPDHAFGRLAGAEEHPRQVHVDHGLPLVERHLADDGAVFDLDQQRVLDDAGVVDDHVEPAEIRNDGVERGHDVILLGDVARIRADVHVA